MTFMQLWIGYAVLGVSAFSAAFVWAVRTRQFTDFDRARFLPLKAAKQIEPEQAQIKTARADRYALLALLLITVIMILSGILVGIRCIGHGACHPWLG